MPPQSTLSPGQTRHSVTNAEDKLIVEFGDMALGDPKTGFSSGYTISCHKGDGIRLVSYSNVL
jgi:hypothetical protein